MTKFVLFTLIFCAALPVGLLAKGPDHFAGNAPEYIYNLMLENECVPIKGFYKGVVDAPPFVSSRELYYGAETIFFACELQNPVGENRYKIVILLDGRYETEKFSHCPGEILFRERAMPGGLSLHVNKNLPAGKYFLWDDTKWGSDLVFIPESQLKSLWILDERRGGVGSGFFCVYVDWYHMSYD